jgi:hypothetical protein
MMSNTNNELASKFDLMAKEHCDRIAKKMRVNRGTPIPVAEIERQVLMVGELIAAQLEAIPAHIRAACVGISAEDAAFIEQQVAQASKFAAAASIHRVLEKALSEQ